MASDSAHHVRLRPIRTTPTKKPPPPPPFCAEELGRGLHSQSEEDSENVSAVHDADDADYEPLTPASRVFCSPSLNMTILVTFGLKTSCNIDALKEGLKSTLLRHKRFCSVVRKGNGDEFYWARTNVNVDDHVIVVTPKGADVSSATFVEDYVTDLMQGPPLDMAKPLFEFHIVKAKLGDAMENMIMRVHHSMGDGMSLMSLVLACTRRVDKPDTMPTLPTYKQKNRIKEGFWKRHFLLLWSVLLMLWFTLQDIFIFTATCFWLKDSQISLKGYSRLENLPKKLVHTTISLDDIRSVKQAVNATVNDVLYGAFVAGFSRYLWEHHVDDTIDLSKNLNSKHMEKHPKRKASPFFNRRIRASAIVNTRPAPGLHEIENMMRSGSKMRWGNEIGYTILPIQLSGFEDPLQCVHEVKKLFDKKKLSLGPLFSYRSGSLIMKLAGVEIATKLTYKCVENTTLSFSNMIGPLEEIQFLGLPITHIIPTVTGQPQALCVHIQSYMDDIKIVLSAAKEIIPDPDKILKYMTDALEEMKNMINMQ